MTIRRLPVPMTFIVVVLATIFLIIFFGAWAASASAGDRDRSLTFGFASNTTNLDATAPKSSQGPSDGVGILDDGSGQDGGDRWWQKGVHKSLPFALKGNLHS